MSQIKLYAQAGTCSRAPHIILQELGLPHELKLLKRGGDPAGWAELARLNPMEAVPVVQTEEGYILTEGPAIMQYLVSRKPNTLFPTEGEARYRAFEWMNFITSALHKGFGPLFSPEDFTDEESAQPSVRRATTANMHELFKITEKKFVGPYAMGDAFTTVDAYLFVVLSWASFVKIDLKPYASLSAFMARMGERPSVKAAIAAETAPRG